MRSIDAGAGLARRARAIAVCAVCAVCCLGIAACGKQAATTTAASTAASTPGATASSHPAGAASADWPQFGDNAQHTSAGAAATGITAASLGRLAIRTVRIGGIADSAPIELHGVRVAGRRRDLVAVTTSYGRTVALDPATGGTLWQFQPSGVNATPGNPQVTTATPAADPDRRYLYTASPNGVIHKLSVATGRQVWARSITYDPRHEKIASALTISGPWVVAVTSGYYGDAPPYDGHVVTISRATGGIDHVWNTECSERHRLISAGSCRVTNTRGDDAIWGRAGAIIVPGSRRILVATGNGPFDGRTSWGDSVLELTPDASALLHNWTPADQASLDAGDTDVGSGSPALLPSFGGRPLVLQGGKAGRLDLLDLDRLNGTSAGAGPRLGGQLATVSTPGGGEMLTQPAVWTSRGATYVFVACATGTGAYELVDPSHPRLRSVWSKPWPATSPVLAGGLLYAYNPGGTLEILEPLSGRVLRSIPVPSGHWNSLAVVGGRVILPTGNYHSSATSSVVEILHLPGR